MLIRKRQLYIVSLTGIFLCMNGLATPGFKPEKSSTSLVFPSFLHTMGIRKATKLHLMIYTRNKVKVRDPQGLTVARLDSWEDPETKKDDDEVTGYGINSGENLIVYNKSMTSLGFYGRNEKGIKKLNRPTAVTANTRGDVYVADTDNHRIVRFFNPKSKLQFVRAIGGPGSVGGKFNAPQGIAMDHYGHVYISDTGNHRIQVLRPDDQIHLWFGDQGIQDGQLWHPAGIAVTNGKERWSHFKDAFIAVVDLDGKRLQKLSLDGEFLAATQIQHRGFESVKLKYPAIDYYSNIWVTDTENHCVHKFDRDLNYLCTFGQKGSGDYEFDEPRGIAIYKRFGQVFIAEKESAQYYWIGTDILNLQSRFDNERNEIVISFFLTEPSYLALRVKVPDRVENTVFSRIKLYSGNQTLRLDSELKLISENNTEKNGRTGTAAFPLGVYRLNLKCEATYSSLNYFVKEVDTSIVIE